MLGLVSGEQVGQPPNHKCSVFGNVGNHGQSHHDGECKHHHVEQSLLNVGHEGVGRVHRVAVPPSVGFVLGHGNNVLLGDKIVGVGHVGRLDEECCFGGEKEVKRGVRLIARGHTGCRGSGRWKNHHRYILTGFICVFVWARGVSKAICVIFERLS